MAKEQFNSNAFAQDGTLFDSQQEAADYDYRQRLALSERLGRPLTDGEWRRGCVAPARDSRSYDEIVADENYSHKKRQKLSREESLLAETEARLEKAPDIKRMSRDEHIAHVLRGMIDREQSQKLTVKTRQEHLESVKSTLGKLDARIDAENWSEDSDQRFRVLLQQARAALVDPEADPVEVKRLLKAVDETVIEQKAQRRAGWLQRKAAVEATLAKIEEEDDLLLSEPEPEPEPERDPNAFPNPMAELEPQPEQEQLPQIAINMSPHVPLNWRLTELVAALPAASEHSQEVWAAIDALKDGNEQPGRDVLDKFAVAKPVESN